MLMLTLAGLRPIFNLCSVEGLLCVFSLAVFVSNFVNFKQPELEEVGRKRKNWMKNRKEGGKMNRIK